MSAYKHVESIETHGGQYQGAVGATHDALLGAAGIMALSESFSMSHPVGMALI